MYITDTNDCQPLKPTLRSGVSQFGWEVAIVPYSQNNYQIERIFRQHVRHMLFRQQTKRIFF